MSSSDVNFMVQIAGLARSCGSGLSDRLLSLEELLIQQPSCAAFSFFILENDSEDDTRSILKDFARGRDNVHLYFKDGLADEVPHRETRIAICRNALLEGIEEASDSKVEPVSIYLPVDLDIDFDWHKIVGTIAEALRIVSSGKLVAVFPSGYPRYYDVHALRARGWNTSDAWRAIERIRAHSIGALLPKWALKAYFIGAPQTSSSRLARIGPLIPVQSAFGGFGIYDFDAVRGRRYASSHADTCEHVAFNRGLSGLAVMTALTARAPSEHLWHIGSMPRHHRIFARIFGEVRLCRLRLHQLRRSVTAALRRRAR